MAGYAVREFKCCAFALFLAAGWVAVAVPVALGQAPAMGSTSSSAANASYVPFMTFDVASVRESKPDPNGFMVAGGFAGRTSSLKFTNYSISNILIVAYGLSPHQIRGLPDWAGRSMYNVQAKADEAADERLATLSKEQVTLEQQHMLQVLLAERFLLKAHRATEEGLIYRLQIARGGSKLRATDSMAVSPEELAWLGERKPPAIHQQGDGRLGYEFFGHNCPLETLVETIGSEMGVEVVDKTGLSGNFDFHLRYNGRTPRGPENDDPALWPAMTDALPEQLGLKLESAKGAMPVFVIDHIERSSEN
jgi:uncharacterized protein (TIGR03435 family)